METYFNIRYEFDKKRVHELIDGQLSKGEPGYICVADGVILNIANRNKSYSHVVNNSMFSICDSSYVPLYLRWLYGIKREQYCGSQIFMDVVRKKKYRMFFLGSSAQVLKALKEKLVHYDKRIAEMDFYELPFRNVEDFDYPNIAKNVEAANADIIWVALGAPKQEIFMSNLKPFLSHGIMIGVGAVFKFYSGLDEKRAPEWMVKHHLEFVCRIFSEPKKQLRRCAWIIVTLPQILREEWQVKRKARVIQIKHK